MVCEARE